MEKINDQKLWAYYNANSVVKPVANHVIRHGPGHQVKSYFKLAMKVAELQYKNRDHVLLFRGQCGDYKTAGGNTTLHASIFRRDGPKAPAMSELRDRFDLLERAEELLVTKYAENGLPEVARIRRHRIIRWTILQHYGVCRTPLLDATHSLRVAASMACHNSNGEAYVFVLGVPNISGAITASSEAGLQIVRLSSACPPNAVRPHIQEGYLLGEYPEFSHPKQRSVYQYWEMDFGRRLVSKFRFNPQEFWSKSYPEVSEAALYPSAVRDPLLVIAEQIKVEITPSL